MAEQWRKEPKRSADHGNPELKRYGFTEEEADTIIAAEKAQEKAPGDIAHDAVVQAFFRKTAEHITSINSGPVPSSMNRFPNGVGDPVGTLYMLDVSKVEHFDEKGQKKEQTGTDRHRLTTMIQACYCSDVFPEPVATILAIEPRKQGMMAAIARWRNKDKPHHLTEPENTTAPAGDQKAAPVAQ
jgi:hypothetical protein